MKRYCLILLAISAGLTVVGSSNCALPSTFFLFPIAETTPTPAPPPLIAATLAGDAETVRSLLQTGSDPNQAYRTNTALTYAARDGFTAIAQVLVEAGADVNWIDGEGVTPLILAAFKGHEDIARLLLEQGADTTIRDQWDRTALDYALRRGDTDPIVQLLPARP